MKRERATAMRLVGDEEGEDGKATVMATRVAGKRGATETKKVMAMVT